MIETYHIGLTIIGAGEVKALAPLGLKGKDRLWLCAINGLNKKFGYDREFLSFKGSYKSKDEYYKFYVWDIELGKVYQYKNFYAEYDNDETFEGYFTVTKIEGVKELTKEDINKIMYGRKAKG